MAGGAFGWANGPERFVQVLVGEQDLPRAQTMYEAHPTQPPLHANGLCKGNGYCSHGFRSSHLAQTTTRRFFFGSELKGRVEPTPEILLPVARPRGKRFPHSSKI